MDLLTSAIHRLFDLNLGNPTKNKKKDEKQKRKKKVKPIEEMFRNGLKSLSWN